MSDSPSEEVLDSGVTTAGRRRVSTKDTALAEDLPDPDEARTSPQPADFAELAEQEAAIAADKKLEINTAARTYLQSQEGLTSLS